MSPKSTDAGTRSSSRRNKEITLPYGKFSSQVAKHQQNIVLKARENDAKALYNFHESI